MEGLSVVLFIVILILVNSLKNNLQKRFTDLESEIRKLREELTALGIENPVFRPKETFTPPPSKFQSFTIVPDPPAAQPVFTEEKSLSDELSTMLQSAETKATTNEAEAEAPSQAAAAEGPVPVMPVQEPRVRKPGFLERNPDMEKFIGENLISKIGIGILVLAIGFFVKYAIDNEWIGAVGRVGVGVICGGILVALGHRMRNSYKAFSSVLAGGGLAIFYFTIALAFHQFQLFSQLVTFIIMVVITGFAVALSLLYNRQELAVIALVGGFATPFMASNGGGNYKALFWYLIILNAGLLVIAYNKAWRLLNLLAFLFTAVIYAAWMFRLAPGVPASTYADALMFATIFYILFFAINIAHNTRENKTFIASDFGILLANTCLYFTAGLYCLTLMKAGEYRGLFTACMGVFNLAASFFLFRNRKIDKNILYLLIGITLSFISLTAPIQLNGHNITLFWAAESVLLFWLFQKSEMKIIRLGSLLVWIAMVVSLLMDWFKIYGSRLQPVAVILNRGFITTIFAAAATYLLFFLRKKDETAAAQPGKFSLGPFFRTAATVLLFGAGALEINHQFQFYYAASDIHVLYLLLYTFSFVLVFTLVSRNNLLARPRPNVNTILLACCIALYLLTLGAVFMIQRDILQQQHLQSHFISHWLAALVVGVIIYRLIGLVRSGLAPAYKSTQVISWILCTAVVIYLSAEIHLLVNNIFYSENYSLADLQRVYVKTGLPILWGLCSFAFMWLGMKHKFRPLRIISLTLFLVTLLKLFIFDIRRIPVGGKIAAFFSLGVLLLVVSFMYQRLKNIIIEDEKKPSV